MPASFRSESLFRRFYYSRAGFVDGNAEFQTMCRQALAGATQILEIGAGPANPTTTFLATLGSVTGVDVSDEVCSNGALTAAHVYDGTSLPFADASFGGCVSNYVIEHIADPGKHFAEVARVLRPGGVYVFRAPNLFHYVALASSLLPHRHHIRFSKSLRAMTKDDHDPWTTYYRANTRKIVRRMATKSGFRVATLRMVEKEPWYARSSRLLFFPLMLYERLVNLGELGSGLRSNMFAVLQKPALV